MSLPDLLLRTLAWGVGALLVAGWATLFLYGVRSRARQERERRLRSLRAGLIRAVLAGSLPPDLREALEALPTAELRGLFVHVAPDLRGRERAWLVEQARALGLVAQGRRMCGSRFWWRRLEGARLLTLVGGGGSSVLELAGDPNPLVRAQVAEWCGANPSDAAVSTLVGMLGDPSQGSRFAVQDALVRVGQQAVEPLREELVRVRDPTEARAALAVARALGDSRLAAPIARLARHDAPEVRAAACRALGRAAGATAAERLEAALEDPEPGVRAAAAHGLGEMGHWQAGSRLAALLRDGSWDVRQAAGRALHRLGPPGLLLLRRSLDADDPFAADMARYVLDVAELERKGA